MMKSKSSALSTFAVNAAPIGSVALLGSIAAFDIAYWTTQATWTAQFSFRLLPVACLLALVVILSTWYEAWSKVSLVEPPRPFANLWKSPLAEVITLIFALSWWFRRDTPDAPSSIALGLSIIGLGVMVWAASRQQTYQTKKV